MMCGEIWWLEFGIPFGSEPGFRRPVLVIQGDILNASALNTTIVLPLSTNIRLADMRGNTLLTKDETGLPKDSAAVGVQISVVDKQRFIEKAGKIMDDRLNDVINECFQILGNEE